MVVRADMGAIQPDVKFCSSLRHFCVTCKLLNNNHLALFRVVYFATLKMPKALIYSRIRVARPARDCKCLVSVSQASPRLRIDAFSAVPYFCPWKYQEQINMGAKETAIPAFAARLYERTGVRYNQMSSSVPVSDILRDP